MNRIFPAGKRKPWTGRAKALVGGVALAALAMTSACAGGEATDNGGSDSSDATPFNIVFTSPNYGAYTEHATQLFELTAALPEYADKVNPSVVLSDATPAGQTTVLNSIIQESPDAIVIIPSSPTALNSSLQRACDAGIVVIAVNSKVDLPCVRTFQQDYTSSYAAVARWMANAIGAEGSVFVDEGAPGFESSLLMANGFTEELAAIAPNVEVAGTYHGEFTPGPAQAGVSNLLVAHPNVSGVMTVGGCEGVIEALTKVGKEKDVAIGCIAYNGSMEQCDTLDLTCGFISSSASIIQDALMGAVNVLEGGTEPAEDTVTAPPAFMYVTAGSESGEFEVLGDGIESVEISEAGVNFFPGGPAGMTIPITLPQFADQITIEDLS